MASATIATKYGTAPRNTWDGTEKIPLDVGGADGVGLASTLKTYVIGAGSVAVTTGKTLTVTNDATISGSPPSLAANTFTGTQTINPAVNTNALAVSGFSVTGTDTHALLDLAGTWNVGSTIGTGIKLDMLDSGSSASSLLLDMRVGGATKFSVQKSGNLLAQSGANFTGTVSSAGFFTGGVECIGNLNVPVTGITFHGRDATTAANGATFLRGGNVAATSAGGPLTISGGLAAGADQAGGLLTLNGGKGTGAGLGGDIALFTAPASGSSSTANSLVEAMRVLGTGQVKFTSSANFSVNASVATLLGSVGPSGANTTVQEWLTIQNASGTVRYIPCF